MISVEAAVDVKARLAISRPDVLLQLPDPPTRMELEDGSWLGWLGAGWSSLARSMYDGRSLLEWIQTTRSRGDVVCE